MLGNPGLIVCDGETRAAGFGMLVDRFGIPWMINCEQA